MNEVATILGVVELPQPCECGSREGTVTATDIEAPDRALLMEVKCKGCGKEYFLPDGLAEGQWNLLGDEAYRPTWFLTEGGELVHWATPEGRRRRWESVFGDVPGMK